MDQLDHEIQTKRQARDKAKSVFEQLDLEVRVLERAASLRPQATDHSRTEAEQARRGGKPIGSISMAWRRVLARLHLLDGYLSIDLFLKEAQHAGIMTTLSSVRDRLRSFEAFGYVEGNSESGYKVTQHAIDKFGLDNMFAEITSSVETEE